MHIIHSSNGVSAISRRRSHNCCSSKSPGCGKCLCTNSRICASVRAHISSCCSRSKDPPSAKSRVVKIIGVWGWSPWNSCKSCRLCCDGISFTPSSNSSNLPCSSKSFTSCGLTSSFACRNSAQIACTIDQSCLNSTNTGIGRSPSSSASSANSHRKRCKTVDFPEPGFPTSSTFPSRKYLRIPESTSRRSIFVSGLSSGDGGCHRSSGGISTSTSTCKSVSV